MDINYYKKYNNFSQLGLKKQASKSLRLFIESFQHDNEKEEWVWSYIRELPRNRHGRIRHEIFQELIYPILKKGYDNHDFFSNFWLGKLSQNIYSDYKIHQELGWKTEINFYEKCFELAPSNDEVRLLIIEKTISWLAYTIHEWPIGILFDNNGATLDECDKISFEIEKIKNIDTEKKYSIFLDEYNNILFQYIIILKNSK